MLVVNKSDSHFAVAGPILLITRMLTDRIGLHSVLLPLLIHVLHYRRLWWLFYCTFYICSGESGAGKTVTVGHITNFIAKVSQKGSERVEVGMLCYTVRIALIWLIFFVSYDNYRLRMPNGTLGHKAATLSSNADWILFCLASQGHHHSVQSSFRSLW